jgi:hypothetical protein
LFLTNQIVSAVIRPAEGILSGEEPVHRIVRERGGVAAGVGHGKQVSNLIVCETRDASLSVRLTGDPVIIVVRKGGPASQGILRDEQTAIDVVLKRCDVTQRVLNRDEIS